MRHSWFCLTLVKLAGNHDHVDHLIVPCYLYRQRAANTLFGHHALQITGSTHRVGIHCEENVSDTQAGLADWAAGYDLDDTYASWRADVSRQPWG